MSNSAEVAIVTGASQGLGRAIALELASGGRALVLSARRADVLAEVADEARAAGAPDVLVQAADLSQPEAPAQVVAQTMERFGRIDVLVNNAGTTKRGDFLNLTDEDFLSGFGLKFHAAVRFCRAAWPALAESGGSIVNISGIGAQTPAADFTIGGSVNSAMINFGKAISKRGLPQGIRVNTVCPGHILTDRLSKRVQALADREGITFDAAADRFRAESKIERYGTPEEIAQLVGFLCSDKAAYIQGTVIVADGGATPGI